MMTSINNSIDSAGVEAATATHKQEIVMVGQTSEEIHKEIVSNKNYFFELLGQADFYAQLMVIASAIMLAAGVAWHLRRKINKYFEQNTNTFMRKKSWQSIMPLVFPLLNAICMLIAKPFLDHMADQKKVAYLSDAAIDLAVAFFFSQLVFVFVKAKPVARFFSTVIMLAAILKVTAFTRVTQAYLDAVAIDLGSVHISLLGMFNGLLIMTFIIWLSQTLTKWLETYLLRKSTLSYSSRDLTVKFFRVTFYLLAISMTLSAMGVDLTAFAVFGGALGVGIGLGLQKITSNFVSGITLLMEKSIKIGDLIEFSGEAGWVRRLNIRYALIETYDGKELIVPNEELTSHTVTNWSYSSNKARIEIPVGVAYGSDLRKVQKILLDCAMAHPVCMKDPEVVCVVREFGDSSINFMLMFWVPDVNQGRWGPQSDVMLAIWDRFVEEGIEIPFPQRVLHHASELKARVKKEDA